MISPVSLGWSFLNKIGYFHHSSRIFNHVERQFSKKIKRIRSDNGGEYISNELKDFFLTSGVIHELTLPYSPESNGIAERFNQTINMIACAQ
jgi:transposase InsO family protein